MAPGRVLQNPYRLEAYATLLQNLFAYFCSRRAMDPDQDATKRVPTDARST